jgi:murein L,D-transpeptidase YafK
MQILKPSRMRKLFNSKRKALRLAALSILLSGSGGPALAQIQAKDLAKTVKYQPSEPEANGDWSDISPPNIPFDRPHIDAELEKIYKEIAASKLDKAIVRVNALINQFPNFRVAYLIRGDLYTLRSGKGIASVGDVRNAPLNKMAALADLREEAVVRLRAYRIRPNANQLPRELVQLKPDQRYAILVDTVRSRLFIYENVLPAPRLITDFYISQGKAGANKTREGDNKTPLGVYNITELLPKQKLSDYYGNLALPLDYPNEWDKREGRTGHGIWLHGIPSNQISTPPKASEGCVVLSNADIEKLQRYVKVGNTPVIITENINFIAKNIWQSERSDIMKMLTAAREVNGQAKQKHGLGHMSVLRYPSQNDMLVVNFDIGPKSNQKSPAPKRQQYWQKDGREWRMVHEAQAG